MPVLFVYLLKLSVSLAVVFLFYQLLLRRLTFYNSNRWYLLVYTILSFFIPFVDISLVLHKNEWSEMNIIQWVPVIYKPAIAEDGSTASINYWFVGGLFIMTGMLIMLVRLLIQFISFRKMMRKAEFISSDGMRIYQVNESIIPFSFGNSIFINSHLHSEDELKEIIRHEFIHVKQRHSFDIIWAEILCLINWYNPFAWLLRKSIRQNLEFIADNQVLENGISKKEYQYLLLKVTGNNQYSIATQFNFSSLKKRIAMMNKTKTAKRQVARFVFLIPVIAIILLSFRKSFSDSSGTQTGNIQQVFTDTIPEVKVPNNKGYFIDIKDKSGECMVVIKDKDKKEVTRLLLTDWNKKAEYYENLYGEIPPAPPKPGEPAQPALPNLEQWIKGANKDVKSVSVVNGLATVTLNNGKTEDYDLNKKEQKENFEKKYGELPEPPSPPVPAEPGTPASPPVPPTPPAKSRNSENSIHINTDVKADFRYENNKVTVLHKDGAKEFFDLSNTESKKEFIAKYGVPVVAPNIVTNITGVQTTAPAIEKTITTGVQVASPVKANGVNDVNVTNAVPVKNITGLQTQPKIATTVNVANVNPVNAVAVSPENEPVLETGILNIGGLTLKDEKQYILVDGKEYTPEPNKILKGPYRITFIKKEEAHKKYGDKAKNGAIIVESIN